MKKVLLYPFSSSDYGVVKYLNILKPDHIVTSVCSLSGSGLIGKDVAFSINSNPIGIVITGNPLNELDNVDVVCICADVPKGCLDTLKLLLNKAAEQHKEVFYYPKDKQSISGLSDKVVFPADSMELINEFRTLTHRVCDVETPVIFIGGLNESVEQVDALLGLCAKFIQMGYTVAGFGENDILEFLGLHSYSFLMSNEISDANKIIYLNNFVKIIETSEHPDIILVQIPGSLMRFNSTIVGDFGVGGYLFCEALRPDYFICCTMFDNFSDIFFVPLSNEFERKYDMKINAIHISNKLLNMPRTMEQKESFFYRIPRENVSLQIKEMRKKVSIPVYDLTDGVDLTDAVEQIIQQLEGE